MVGRTRSMCIHDGLSALIFPHSSQGGGRAQHWYDANRQDHEPHSAPALMPQTVFPRTRPAHLRVCSRVFGLLPRLAGELAGGLAAGLHIALYLRLTMWLKKPDARRTSSLAARRCVPPMIVGRRRLARSPKARAVRHHFLCTPPHSGRWPSTVARYERRRRPMLPVVAGKTKPVRKF